MAPPSASSRRLSYVDKLIRITVACACLTIFISSTRVALDVNATHNLGNNVGDNNVMMAIDVMRDMAPHNHEEDGENWRKRSEFWSNDGGRLAPPPPPPLSFWQRLPQDVLHYMRVRRRKKNIGDDNSKPVEWYEDSKSNLQLWKSFSGGLYRERNQVMSHLIRNVAKPARVFEFAGNGAFLPRQVLLDIANDNNNKTAVLQHWVHSEFSKPVLQYASFLFDPQNRDVFWNASADIDHAFRERNGQESKIPLKTRVMSPSTAAAFPGRGSTTTTVVEVVNIDMADLNVIQSSVDFAFFDMIITISFEHFGRDLEMITKVFAPGCWFLFGVAGFADRQHFRHFTSEQEIRQRYDPVLDIVHIKPFMRRGEPTPRKFAVLGRVKEKTAAS